MRRPRVTTSISPAFKAMVQRDPYEDLSEEDCRKLALIKKAMWKLLQESKRVKGSQSG